MILGDGYRSKGITLAAELTLRNPDVELDFRDEFKHVAVVEPSSSEEEDIL